jgi:hypothetical protein
MFKNLLSESKIHLGSCRAIFSLTSLINSLYFNKLKNLVGFSSGKDIKFILLFTNTNLYFTSQFTDLELTLAQTFILFPL